MNFQARRILLAGLLLVPLSTGRGLEAAPTPAGDVYVRGQRDIPQTVERVLSDASVASAGAVVFAFEASTFAPPPGRTEFTAFYGFQRDAAAWTAALVAASHNAAAHLYGITSLQRDLIDLDRPAAADALTRALNHRWSKEPKAAAFVPAARWMADAVRDAKRLSKAPRVALVYLTDRVSPERVFEYGEDVERERGWRQRLLEPGQYFDEEAVGRKLAELGVPLVVIAPEAHFEDFTPVAELPSFPWASRPEILSFRGLGDFPDLPTGVGPPATPGGPPGATPGGEPGGSELTAEELEELLKALPPDTPEFVKQGIRDHIKRLRPRKGGSAPPPESPEPLPGDGPRVGPRPPPSVVPPEEPPPTTDPDEPLDPLGPPTLPRWGAEGRFDATTPTWFPRLGMRTGWCNHVPSSYGHWPFARAASLSGGRYVFYPFPPGTWLDTCPTSAPQLGDLAPELVKRSAFARVGAGDAAWDALARAARLLVDDTPWCDGVTGERWASGWGSFLGTSPLQAEKSWDARRRPCDDALGHGSAYDGEWRKFGDRLLDDVLPLYARAIRDVDAVLAALRAPGAARPHPRALADLTLGRFWLSLSRFHLHALGLYAKEIDRFKPDDPKESVDRYVITYVPTIRMSDVLDAYDGRTLAEADETKYPRHVLAGVKGQQGNLLSIPGDNHDYRARRAKDSVLRFLDQRLLPDAEDLLGAASRVMERYAKTPWGWTTYYTDVYAFVWLPVPPSKGSVGPQGGVIPSKPPEDLDAPVTPGGGSTPGGPTTPGR